MDHGHAAAGEVPHDAEQLFDLRLRERGGRLVEDEDLQVPRDRLRDLHHLLLADGEAGEGRGGVDLHVQPRQKFRRAAVLRLLVEEDPAAAGGLPPDKEVLGHREVVHHVELLVNDADPHRERVRRVAGIEESSEVPDLARIAPLDAGEDLHERRLAGPVLAHQGVDLARREVEIDRPQRVNAREPLVDPPHGEHLLSRHPCPCREAVWSHRTPSM